MAYKSCLVDLHAVLIYADFWIIIDFTREFTLILLTN